ncbi:MAG TPA: adenylosuccinate lyase [Kiritimatiellia bacterium]|nr:adenylosuccinate lyase [Kiritimatiellia bacterium]
MIDRYTRPEMGALWTDERKFQTWLDVELAACAAMAQAGRIPRKDWTAIRRKAGFDVKRIRKIEAEVRHDVIAFLTNVAEHVGPAARHVHKGLTSSDVVDTALSVNLVKAADLLLADVDRVRAAAARLAEKHAFTPMIGRSHGIHAEPTTFGLKMALMYDEFGRARARLAAARETVRVGKLSGAVGTHAHLDPKIEAAVCKRLGLRPAAISTQILQRDRHAEFAAALALVGASVERWAQEFRHLQRTEVGEVEEFFGRGQKGSSAMPHKKNPVVGEQLCGLARVLRGHALAALENVALWHERDISHSSAERIILPDATILLDYMLDKLAALVAGLKVDAARMRANLDLTHGLIHSQQVLLLLVEKGVAREDAYRWVQRNALEAWRTGRPLLELVAADADVAKKASRGELAACFDLKRHFRDVKRTFRALGLSAG